MQTRFIIRTSLSLMLCATALAACASHPPADGTDTQPIVGGHSDKGHDPAVIAIDIDGQALCSGTLIAPDVVLTARHCVSHTSETVSCPAQGRQITGDYAPSDLVIYVGDDVATATPVAKGEKLFVEDSDELCEHDIALIKLDRPVAGIAPLGVGLGRAPAAGDLVRAVGFGRRGDVEEAGKKYSRPNVRVAEVSSAEFMVGESTCEGDSGGPALDPSSGEVVGVVSRGGPECDGPDVRNIYSSVAAFSQLFLRAGVIKIHLPSGDGAPGTQGASCGPQAHCHKGFHCNKSSHTCQPAD